MEMLLSFELLTLHRREMFSAEFFDKLEKQRQLPYNNITAHSMLAPYRQKPELNPGSSAICLTDEWVQLIHIDRFESGCLVVV